MNILKIIVALIGAYGLFVVVSYLLARLLFPKIQIDETEEEKYKSAPQIRAERRLNRPVKRQKNLAY